MQCHQQGANNRIYHLLHVSYFDCFLAFDKDFKSNCDVFSGWRTQMTQYLLKLILENKYFLCYR